LVIQVYMSEAFHNLVSIITKSFKIDDKAIEELRVILSEQNDREVSHDEAEKIGRSLVTVIETLANGRTIIANRSSNDGRE
jgi:hypothetical protein